MIFTSLFSYEINKLGVFFIICFIIAALILIFSLILTTSNPDVEKLSAYECGFDPYEDARNVFDVRFYLVAILFLVFDLEAIFLYPLCASFSFLNDFGFYTMLDFIFELLIGYIYAWEIGALEWH